MGGAKSSNQGKRSAGGGPVGCLAAFALVWLGMVFAADAFLIAKGYALVDARRRYVSVEGVVTASEVETRRDSEGATYRPRVAYDYRVAGVEYRGTRYAVFDFLSSGSRYAHTVVREHPVGAVVEVYYDPRDPTKAALDLSDASVPYVLLLVAMPFHCVGLGLFGGALRSAWRWRKYRDARAVVPLIVRSDRERIVLRDSHWSGAAVFFVGAGVSSFLLIFVVGIFADFEASRGVVVWLLAGSLGVGMLCSGIVRLAQGRGHTLSIDRLGGRFTRSGGVVGMGFDEVLVVRLHTKRTNTRVNDRAWYRHELSALDAGGTEHRLLVIKGHKEAGEDARDWFGELFRSPGEGEVPPGDEDGPDEEVSEIAITRTKP